MVFYGIFFTFSLNDGIFCKILLFMQNIVMDVNNVMWFSAWVCYFPKIFNLWWTEGQFWLRWRSAPVKMLGAWCSMIGYITGFSLVGFYTMAETFLVENFKYGCKMSWLLDMTTIPRGSLLMSSFVDNLKPSYEKLALCRTPALRILFVTMVFHLVRHTNCYLK